MSIRLRDDHIILLVLTVIIRKAYQSKEFFCKISTSQKWVYHWSNIPLLSIGS